MATLTGKERGCDRFDQRHRGWHMARAFAAAGANIVLNGMGAPADIEKERSGIETEFKVKAVHSPADMTKPAEIAEMIALGERTFGSVDVSRQQCRRPVRIADRGVSDRQMGRHHRDQTCRRRFHGIRAVVPGMKKRGWGPHHQYGFGAFAGGLAVQVGLCVGQAWHRRPHQDGGAGACDLQDHLQLHQSGLRLDAAGREADSRHHEGAQT